MNIYRCQPYRLLIATLLLCLFLPLPASASPSVAFGPAPAWVVASGLTAGRPDEKDVNDGYYTKLLELESNIQTGEDYTHAIRHIVSDAGVQEASNLSISFNPSYEQLTVHSITVWRDGKPSDRLRKNAFKVLASEEDLSRFIYNGNYSAFVMLEDIRRGDEVEYSYTVKGSNPVFGGKFFNSLVLQSSDPVGHIHYRIVTPQSRALTLKYFNDATKATVTNTPGSIVYDWDLTNIKGLDYTGNMPGWYIPVPFVQITEYKSWSEVADWGWSINQPDTVLKGALGKRVAAVVEKYPNDKSAIFRALVDIVQSEVRYMGVEIGPYSHKANDPARVYTQRYGDCKDKSLLLVSMLRSAGISADMALVHSDYKGKIADRLPSPSVFDHAIAVAHLPGGDVWVDATMSYQGGSGTDIYCPPYGCALLVKPGTDKLTIIPESKNGDIKYTEEYDATDVRMPVTLTVTTTYSGYQADDIRYQFASQSKNDLEKNYLDYYVKIYPEIEKTDTLVVKDDIEQNTVQTVERYTITNFFEFDSGGHNYSASFYASMIKNLLPEITKRKTFPVAVTYPYKIHYQVHLNGPLHWNIEMKEGVIDRPAYSFTYRQSATPDRLSLEYDFAFLKDHIAPAEIEQYERDRKKMVNEHLYFNFTYNDGAVTPTTGNTNYWAILAFICLAAGSAWVGRHIYRLPTQRSFFASRTPRAIGGWLILPILGFVVVAGRSMYYLFTAGFFGTAIWHVYDTEPNGMLIRALLAGEFAVNFITSAYAIFCLILIFCKRDIAPFYIKVFYIYSVVAVILDSTFAHMFVPGDVVEYKEIYRTLFGAAIWGAYFSRSIRVKQTFVIPYPNDEHS